MNDVLNNDSDRIAWRFAMMVSLLFFMKALILSFWLTPFGDIPDEPDHFAYVKSIAIDNEWPLLGKAKTIKFDAYGGFDDANALNPILQHPPFYYIFAGLTYKAFSWFTGDESILLRSPRVVSALSGALTLLVLFGLLKLNGINHVVSLCAVISISSIPMYSNLASGVSSEMTLLLLVTLAIFYWFKFYLLDDVKSAYFCAFLFSLAIVTKITALAVAVPMLFIIVVELKTPLMIRLRSILILFAAASFIPALWFARNIYYFGEVLVTRNSLSATQVKSLLDIPIKDSFSNYIGANFILDHFFINFFGLFGYLGTKRNQMSDYGGAVTHQVMGVPQYIYTIIMLVLLVSITAIYLNRLVRVFKRMGDVFENRKSIIDLVRVKINTICFHENSFYIVLFLPLLVVLLTYYFLYSATGATGEMRHVMFSLVPGLVVASIVVIFLPLDRDESVVAYMWLIIGAFCSVLLWKVFGGYLKTGSAVAIHGRYLFILIPVFLVTACITVSKFKNVPLLAVLVVPLLMSYAEIATYIGQVIPFYRGGL